MGVLAAATRIGGSMLGGWGAQQLGYQPGSWGNDLASLGSGLLGGYGGYRAVDKPMPNRFFYRGTVTRIRSKDEHPTA